MLKGLSKAQLNGLRGVILPRAECSDKGRLPVRLDKDNELLSVRPHNLELMLSSGAEEASSESDEPELPPMRARREPQADEAGGFLSHKVQREPRPQAVYEDFDSEEGSEDTVPLPRVDATMIHDTLPHTRVTQEMSDVFLKGEIVELLGLMTMDL